MSAADDHFAERTETVIGSRPPYLPPAYLARLLGHAGLRTTTVDPAVGELPDGAASWQDTLAARCRLAGVRTRELSITDDEAIAAVRPRLPLATFAPSLGWLALTGVHADRVRVMTEHEPERWLSRSELARSLCPGGGGTATRRAWLALEPALPTASSTSHRVKLAPFRRLVELVRLDRGELLTIVLYAIFVGLLSLATPIAVQQLVNTVAFGGLIQPVAILAFLLFGGLSFAALLSVLQAYLAELIQRRVFVRTSVELAHRLPRVARHAFGEKHGPELVNRFLDLATIQKTGAALLLDGTSVALQTFVGLLILSFYHPLMLGFSIVLVASILFVMLVLGRGATRTAIGESSAKYAITSWMQELARHPSAFRGRAGRDWAIERADALATSWVAARRGHFRVVLRQIVGSTGLNVFVSTLLLGLGGALVVSGQLTLGQLVASEIIVAAVVASFARLGKQLESYYDLLASVDKIGVMLDLELEREGGRVPRRGAGPGELEAVGVSATSHDGRPLFTGIDLRVAAGERLAVMARSARRRSGLLDLLCGLRAPDSGYVALDGDDLRELRLESVREQVVCIRQPEIFAGTIAENLRVGRIDATTDVLRDALDAVGLLHEVRDMPDGLETRVATNGWPLTRSQAIRLMLARAIIARPRVLALDDVFALMDEEDRERVVDAVLAPDAPWTALVVSSDPKVVARCTRIHCIDGGIDRADHEAAASGPSPDATRHPRAPEPGAHE